MLAGCFLTHFFLGTQGGFFFLPLHGTSHGSRITHNSFTFAHCLLRFRFFLILLHGPHGSGKQCLGKPCSGTHGSGIYSIGSHGIFWTSVVTHFVPFATSLHEVL